MRVKVILFPDEWLSRIFNTYRTRLIDHLALFYSIMKKSLKKFDVFLFELTSWVIYLFFLLIYKSCRIEYSSKETLKFIHESEKPLICAFWHGRLFPMCFVHPKSKKFYAIISRHLDGEIIARTIAKMGVRAIRGSTNRMAGEAGKTAKNRGGTSVLRESLRVLEQGNNLAITPDGPRGPARIVKENFFAVAAQKKIPVVPISFSCKSGINLSTWDNFLLPLPFSKISIIFGEILVYDEQKFMDEKTFSREIERSLNNITDKIDKIINET